MPFYLVYKHGFSAIKEENKYTKKKEETALSKDMTRKEVIEKVATSLGVEDYTEADLENEFTDDVDDEIENEI